MPTEGIGNKKVADTLTLFYDSGTPASFVDKQKYIERNYPGDYEKDQQAARGVPATDSIAKGFWKQFNRLNHEADTALPGMFESQKDQYLRNAKLQGNYSHVQAFPIGEGQTRTSVEKAKPGPNSDVTIIDHSGGSKNRYGGEEGDFWKGALCTARDIALGTCQGPKYGQGFANAIERDVTSQGYDAPWSGFNPKGSTQDESLSFLLPGTVLSEGESVTKTYSPQSKEEIAETKRQRMRDLNRRSGRPINEGLEDAAEEVTEGASQLMRTLRSIHR